MKRREFLSGASAALAIPCFAQAMDYKLDARDAMQALYGAGWTYRTAPHVGSDLGAAVNALTGWRELIIPPTGDWMLKTPIQGWGGNHVHGAGGSLGTRLIFDNTKDDFISLVGLKPGGKTGQFTVTLERDLGDVAGSQVVMWKDAAGSPHHHVFEDLNISSEPSEDGVIRSFWNYPVSANGLVPFGIRVCEWRKVNLFCCRNGASIYFAVEWLFNHFGIWVPKLGTPGADISINNSTEVSGFTLSAGTMFVNSTDTSMSLFHHGAVVGSPASGFVTQVG